MQKPQSTSPKKWEPDISSNHNAKSVFNTSEAEAGGSRWSKIWRACWRKGNHNSPSTSWVARKPTTWQHACWTDWSKDCVHKIRTESTCYSWLFSPSLTLLPCLNLLSLVWLSLPCSLFSPLSDSFAWAFLSLVDFFSSSFFNKIVFRYIRNNLHYSKTFFHFVY